MRGELTTVSFNMASIVAFVNVCIDTVLKIARVPAVAFEGDDWTSEMNDRVEISFVKLGIARKSSKMPSGGVGAS